MNQPDADALYVALVGNPSHLRDTRQLTYRCVSRGCLLLDAIAVGEAVLLHQNRFKNSDEVNQRRSSASGRERNTSDGDRHWLPRTYWLEQSALAYPDDQPPPRQSLQCDHVGVRGTDDLTLSAADFHADWGAGHAEIRVRADGSRYAVA